MVYTMISYAKLWYHSKSYDITVSRVQYHRSISWLWYHTCDIIVWYHTSGYDIIPKTVISHDPRFQMLQVVQPVGPQLCRPKGQCLGYCLHACAQRATAEIALVSGGATYSESLAKLETWNWNYWISSCPFRDSGSRYKRCKILAQSLVGLIIGYTE